MAEQNILSITDRIIAKYQPAPRFTRATAEENEALDSFASANGRCWKAILLSNWENGRSFRTLEQIRNQRGSAWLQKYKRPRSV